MPLPNRPSDFKAQDNDDYLLRQILLVRRASEALREETRRLREETRGLREVTTTAITYGRNWRRFNNLAEYEVQCQRFPNGLIALRGTLQRTTEAFGFPVELGRLPVENRPARRTHLYFGATDSRGVHSVYRAIVESTGEFTSDFGLTGIAADGAVGTVIQLEGLSFTTF